MQLIYCCGCGKVVAPRLTDGRERYPHRPDLHDLPFWKCDACGNFVGCHHKTKNRTQPLGTIPTPRIRILRMQIHAELDPLWKEFGLSRKQIYGRLSKVLGREYHTAEINSEEEAGAIQLALRRIRAGLRSSGVTKGMSRSSPAAKRSSSVAADRTI